MNNDEKIREYMEEPEIPEELSPENIKVMLDERCARKKRSKISVAGRITAVAAALAIIVTGGYIGTRGRFLRKDTANMSFCEDEKNNIRHDGLQSAGDNNLDIASDSEEAYVYQKLPAKPYMTGASSYGQVYRLFSDAHEEYAEKCEAVRDEEYLTDGVYFGTNKVVAPAAIAENDADTSEPDSDLSGVVDHSDTYNQEENVLEADIVKTDGERIYMLCNNISQSYDDCGEWNGEIRAVLRVASVEDGRFTSSYELDVTQLSQTEGDDWSHSTTVSDMYLYNGMIAVISTDYAVRSSVMDDDDVTFDRYFYEENCNTFVSFYTAVDEPQYIGTYTQEGSYADVRIAPDGYMYLLTNCNTCDFDCIDGEDDCEKYIPTCGVGDEIGLIQAEDILLPNNKLDSCATMSYTVIGSIDMTVSSEFRQADVKALAGYTGSIYCSADNLYTQCGWEETEITRIAIGGGSIVPAASGKIEGHIRDQFSMSEYGGFFRVASTVDKWNEISYEEESRPIKGVELERYNVVTVLDMDMNVIGKSESFGEDEEIKSVNFSGDMGYVVTFRQTDPLFAFDLSDPSAPVITDEYKLPGYSSYMQRWDDGLLLGFGADADENGRENGIKLVMFDNSDPYDLKETDSYTVNCVGGDEWVGSFGLWERKALLIAPEKNLIGFPVIVRGVKFSKTKYVFVSYEDGEFVYKGEISDRWNSYPYDINRMFRRAVCIGNYVYALSEERFVSADIDTLAEVDSVSFAME